MERLTAFVQQEHDLRLSHAQAPFAATSLLRPLGRCELTSCQGMCCYDGVYVRTAEAEAVLSGLAREEAAFFHSLGMELPEDVIVDGDWKGKMKGRKTAVVPRRFSETTTEFPRHFHDTACAFLAPDGRCSLQVLSEARGRHRWYYKPLRCWTFPLLLIDQGAPCIRLPDRETDPDRLPDYDGFVSAVPCGREAHCGQPAYQVLSEELRLLGQIIGRDLLAEVEAARDANRRGASDPHTAQPEGG